VFSRAGKPIKDFRKAWEDACTRAGVGDALLHDMRRSGVRNLVRAGVSEKTAMKISGHRTRNVFDRYDITSEKDLGEAMKKVQTHLNRKKK
jgi:integrase